jgi:hypothetical protein
MGDFQCQKTPHQPICKPPHIGATLPDPTDPKST